MLKRRTILLILAAGESAIALSIGAFGFVQSETVLTDDEGGTVVIVSARRKALQSATERKQNSDTMIDSVVADDAGKLPDNSVTEVLQRVSGVTMVRFSALG